MIKRFSIYASVALIAASALKADAPPLDGTMPEDYMPALRGLLKTAVERSPSTLAASIAVSQAEAGVYNGEAPLWPQISVSGGYQITSESESTGKPVTAAGFDYSASVSQSIFQWGALKNQAVAAKLTEKIAERQYADTYRILAVSIREQYMGLIGKHIVLRNAVFALKLAKESLVVAQAKFDAGNSSEAELGTFKLNVEQAQLDTDRAQEDFAYTDRVFSRLVGVDVIAEDAVPIELPHPIFMPEKADEIVTGFVGDGIESTFQSEIYHMLLETQDRNYSIAKVRLLPKLSAGASFSYSRQTSIQGSEITQPGVQSESYSLNGSWAIFDGFATRGAKMQALEARRSVERQKQSYVDQAVDQIYDMRQQLGIAYRTMQIAETHNNLIAAEVKRLGDDKDLGYASQATIDAGITTLNATQYQQAFTRSDFYSHWTEFVSLAGLDPALQNLSPHYVR